MSNVDPISRTQSPAQSLEHSLETSVAAETLAMYRETGAGARRFKRRARENPPELPNEQPEPEQTNLPATTGKRLNTKA